ncbi:MAG TPA: hypothetical protein VME92_20565 [Acetobacteraceae bacterium]|nr:hypothetical protein [Acetobacteraceae bacterium]
MRIKLRWCLPLLAGLLLAPPVRAGDIGWQEAVARMAAERTQAIACVRLLKKYGSAAAIDRGSLVYADAKAEYDGIIAGLDVALARAEPPSSLPDLEARLRRGFAKRAAFCGSVSPLIPADSGSKGVIDEIVSGAVGPLIQAVQAIYLRIRDDNAAARKTIATELEATSWPSFASVSSSS